MQLSENKCTDRIYVPCLQVLNEELLGTRSQMEAEREKVSLLETRLTELEVGSLQEYWPKQTHLSLFNVVLLICEGRGQYDHMIRTLAETKKSLNFK